MSNMGKLFIIIGLLMVLVGIIITFLGNRLDWFGNTPLDFKYEGKNTQFYAPIGSMILISIGLSLLLNIILRWFK